MEIIREHVSLQPYNSFHIPVKARYFLALTEEEQLASLPGLAGTGKHLVLGGGSNILFCDDYDGLIIHPRMKGIRVLEEKSGWVRLRVMAGENWDSLVEYTVSRNWGGLENLSLIPGNVGAAPIQNIGAYGTEAGEFIESVETIEIATGEHRSFSGEECHFGYRDSIFKQEWKGKLIILSVIFRLSPEPVYRTAYAQVEEEVRASGEVNLLNIRHAIIRIRQRKLPDPEVTGNAGSFFKNPVVPASFYQSLRDRHPDLPAYGSGDRVKLPAAWLIDQAGWKGYREGDAGVHHNQALVLVNYGQAGGRQIFDLSERIRESVKEKFGVELEREVTVI